MNIFKGLNFYNQSRLQFFVNCLIGIGIASVIRQLLIFSGMKRMERGYILELYDASKLQ